MILIFLLFALVHFIPSVHADGLRDLAVRNELTYGCATKSTYLLDPAFDQAFARECGVLVSESEMKMNKMLPVPNVWDFRATDWLHRYAQTHGQQMRGHVLVWGGSVPTWATGLPWPQLQNLMISHIQAVMARYPDVTTWDVFNEPLEPGIWASIPDAIGIALQTAKAANLRAQVTLNEFGLERDYWKQQQMLSLIDTLQRRNIPLDALGVQGHLQPSSSSFTRFTAFCRAVRARGVEVLVTELDVRGNDDAMVAVTYRNFLEAALACGIKTIITWGISDLHTWLNGFRPLPLDANLQRKPAWFALAESFQRLPLPSQLPICRDRGLTWPRSGGKGRESDLSTPCPF